VVRAFYAGDMAYHLEFGAIGSRCGPFDFVMIPIGAYDPRWFMRIVHADPDEAVEIYQDLIAPHRHQPLPVMLGVDGVGLGRRHAEQAGHPAVYSGPNMKW
jgi:L-ascorbate metabolism protein UlaG (beta-lactamase superfamily)